MSKTQMSENEFILKKNKISRHLMILTDNIMILPLIAQEFQIEHDQLIFGSFFNEDRNDFQITQDLKNVANSISLGKLVVLVQEDQLFEPLYDLLNQNYSEYSGQYFTRISFGPTRKITPISLDSRIIVMMDKTNAYTTLSPAILNRFEKQLLTAQDFIKTKMGLKILEIIEDAFQKIESFSEIKKDKLILCYNQETIPSLVVKLEQGPIKTII
ncbi:hypothetical protein M0811_02667 [Anaeramoeba ignava]|uniref:Uncharacterized protein n=1 Tax=Anaeramoeba ignava TaxID=1746090 RepID=A0A9Q0R678_ANAIG|nr:hypothetical protein M0811_02667 [Anaeramoeba ignava]